MAPRHGQPPARRAQASQGSRAWAPSLGWPGPMLSGVLALSHLVTLDQDPPERETPGRGPSNKSISRTSGTEFLGEVADYGKRAERLGLKPVWEPRGTWVSLTLCPGVTVVVTVVRGWAVSRGACLPSRGPDTAPGTQGSERWLSISAGVGGWSCSSPALQRGCVWGELCSVPREAGGHGSELHSE